MLGYAEKIVFKLYNLFSKIIYYIQQINFIFKYPFPPTPVVLGGDGLQGLSL